MRKLVSKLTLLLLLFFTGVFMAAAQTPNGIAYQSVIRNAGEIAVGTDVVVKISILKGSPSGSAVYVETQSLHTNTEGLVSLIIGNGTAISGSLSDVKWGSGSFFIKEEVSFNGSGVYTSVNTQPLNSVPYSLHASSTRGMSGIKPQQPATYKVGDLAQGGVVFWVDETGTRGLVCATTDLFEMPNWTGSSWSNGVNKLTGITGNGFGAGKNNTLQQIMFQGNDNTNGVYAAKVCADYSVTQGNITYGDWYLPSRWELMQLYNNRATINATAVKVGGRAFADNASAFYWSSNEFDANKAWFRLFTTQGGEFNDLKSYKLQIRPIRAFYGTPGSNVAPSNGSDTQWTQKEFVLSTFFALGGSGDKVAYEKILSQTWDAGITHVETSFLNGATLRAALDVAETIGIKVLAQDLTKFSGMVNTPPPGYTQTSVTNEINSLKTYKNLYGYYIYDEPNRSDFTAATNLRNYAKAADPGRLAYSLCLPSYGPYTWGASGSNKYSSYVDDYIATVNPEVISMDYYPFQENKTSVKLITNDMWRDYGYLRQKAMATNKPLWFYFQAVGMKPAEATIVNLERIRAQMYAGLVYGVKGLSYYHTFGVLLDSTTFDKKPRYESLKSLNSEVKNLGNFLFDKKTEKLYHTNISVANRSAYFLDDIAGSTIILSAPNTDGLIIGIFGDDSTKKYLMVVNKNIDNAISGTITLKAGYRVLEFDKKANIKKLVSANSSLLNISLPAGEAILYVLDTP